MALGLDDDYEPYWMSDEYQIQQREADDYRDGQADLDDAREADLDVEDGGDIDHYDYLDFEPREV